VTSFQGQTGTVTLSGGSGISLSGTTINNTDAGSSQNIFKIITAGGTDITAGSNSDQLTFAAGSGITLTGDANNKIVTITSNSSGVLSGLTTNGVLYATSATTATSTDGGTNGYILKSNGPGLAPTWSAPGNRAWYGCFNFIDSGTIRLQRWWSGAVRASALPAPARLMLQPLTVQPLRLLAQ